jgi:hemolysin activation/secretion protein
LQKSCAGLYTCRYFGCKPGVATAFLLTGLFLVLAGRGICQGLPVLDYSGRSTDSRPEILPEEEQKPENIFTLPPVEQKVSPQDWTSLESVYIREINVTGSTVFPEEEIAEVTGPYEDSNLTMGDMESLRRDLTLLYVNNGYVNSGAVIPDQTVADGVLTLHIVEGKLTTIHVEDNKWFNDDYLRNRIALGAGVPVNVQPLQKRLQLLQQDQRIQLIHAELRPGTTPGEGELFVRVEETPPISVWLGFNNYQSASVGAERGLATLAHQNLTGHGDIFSFTYGFSEGLNPLIDTWYVVPVTVYDTTLMLRYRRDDATVVDNVFGPLDIVSESNIYEINLRQPVYRTLRQEVALSLAVEYEESETSLDGEPFSFVSGVEESSTTVVPLRFSLEWTYRTQRQAFAARSRFSYGMDVLDATTGDDGAPDARFLAWLGQVQWAQNFDFLNAQLLARADLQLANDPLLPVEQISVGGRYSVRGYRENLIVSDEAFIASAEVRIPLIRNKPWAEYLQVAPFYDYGKVNNVDGFEPDDLSSIGVGLRWGTSLGTPNFRADAEVYWGHQLRDVDTPSYEGLQDDGIHFQIALLARF